MVHDIDMALRFFSRLLVMKDGRIVADGVPHVSTDSLIHEVFGARGTVQNVPQTSFPLSSATHSTVVIVGFRVNRVRLLLRLLALSNL